jgi:hypothetical protein
MPRLKPRRKRDAGKKWNGGFPQFAERLPLPLFS